MKQSTGAISAAFINTPPLLIRRGRIVDPSQGFDAAGDLLLADGKVIACGRVTDAHLQNVAANTRHKLETIDAHGLIITPGWVDMHAHLREPGGEQAETIRSGARAAAAGGYTTLACLPDTKPPIDTESATEYVRLQSERAAGAEVHPICALTKGCEGTSLAELGQLARAGAVAFSDVRPLADSSQLFKGLKYAAMFGRIVIDIPRDPWLGGGVMNAGLVAALAGLSGSPAVAEEIAVVRGCLLARESEGHYHAAHISTHGAVKQFRAMKAEIANVSCAVAVHNLLLTEDLVRERYHTRYKLRPPLRGVGDVNELIEGLRDGTVDCLVSAHAPVADEGKGVEFDVAPFGGSMLEAALSATLETLHHRAGLPLGRIVELVSTRPAELLGMKGVKGTLAPGAAADATLIDLSKERVIEGSRFLSKSHVCPLEGLRTRGSVTTTIVAGKVFSFPQ